MISIERIPNGGGEKPFSRSSTQKREGAEKREIAMVYLNRNLWSTYIQPHLQEQNEDEMIYLGKAADMDIIYYGKFDVENFYEKIPEILKEMTPIWKK